MNQFSVVSKYVATRARSERRMGVEVRLSSTASNVTVLPDFEEEYMQNNFVNLFTAQTVAGEKNFIGGLKVSGILIDEFIREQFAQMFIPVESEEVLRGMLVSGDYDESKIYYVVEE